MSALLFILLATPAAAAGRPAVEADARVELAAALHLLAAARGPLPGFADDGGDYARVLVAISSPAASHAAVDSYRRLLQRPAEAGTGYMAALRELTACLDSDLRLTAGRDCARSPLAGAAANFAAATSFAALWRERGRPLLADDVAALARERDRADLVGLFELYTGVPAAGRHTVSPSPLLARELFWNGLTRGATGTEIVTVLSPARGGRAGARFDWTPVMRDVWHEQAHALLDPWLDEEEGRRVLSRPALSGEALRACYGSWPQCVREHAAQGVAAAVLAWARREKRLPFYADVHPKENLPLLPQAAARLREYERGRARWPTLRAFYPRLLAALEGAPVADAAATGSSPLAPGEAELTAGLEAYARGDAAEAERLLARAVEREPRLAPAWLSLAVVREELGLSAPARQAADRAASLGREDGALAPEFLADALSTRARLRLASGDRDGARADWKEALESAPANWSRAEETRRALSGAR